MDISLEEKSDWAYLKYQIINVAAQLSNDKIYTKEHAVTELKDIIRFIEQLNH